MTREELRNKVKTLPAQSGVYIMKDDKGSIIYVGKAKILRNRVKSYFDDSPKTQKTYALVSNIDNFEYILTQNELDAFSLESNLIHKYKPKYNILLKDDKSFPYLAINTNEKFPRVQIVRRPKHKPGVLLFGPYVTGLRVSTILDLIKSAFPIRTCNINFDKQKKKIRPCLHGEIGNCMAPCKNPEDTREYDKIITDVIDFLNGKTSTIKAKLTQNMNRFAENLKFEEALDCKNKIEIIDKMNSNLISSFDVHTNIDVFGEYYDEASDRTAINVCIVRNGKNVGQQNYLLCDDIRLNENLISEFVAQYYREVSPPNEILIADESTCEAVACYLSEKFGKKIKVSVPQIGVKRQILSNATLNAKEYLTNSSDRIERQEKLTIGALKELGEILNISTPNRIEGYDVSNISGTNSVASMVVFVDGEAQKSEYRKFKIKTIEGADDFASMRETLSRRAEHILSGDEKFPKPNLIVIDGGIGQLHSASEALSEKGIIVPIVSLAKKDEEIYTLNSSSPIKLPKNNYALRLLVRVRDEAHRFAVLFHRSLRNKSLKSLLEGYHGLGKQRISDLYKHFKTIENILNASPDDLCKIPGIGEKLAISIYKELHK